MDEYKYLLMAIFLAFLLCGAIWLSKSNSSKTRVAQVVSWILLWPKIIDASTPSTTSGKRRQKRVIIFGCIAALLLIALNIYFNPASRLH